jgi:hypothetical protein
VLGFNIFLQNYDLIETNSLSPHYLIELPYNFNLLFPKFAISFIYLGILYNKFDTKLSILIDLFLHKLNGIYFILLFCAFIYDILFNYPIESGIYYI